MTKSKTKSMPKHRSLRETVEFFEAHDLGDYLDAMPEAHFDIDLKHRTHVIALDEDLAESIRDCARETRPIPNAHQFVVAGKGFGASEGIVIRANDYNGRNRIERIITPASVRQIRCCPLSSRDYQFSISLGGAK